MLPDAATILVIDDDETVRDMLLSVLARAGYRCLEACDAAAGAKILAEATVDVAITDLKMPGTEERDVIPMLQATSKGKVPFIVVTGHPTVETAVGSVSGNVFAYLIKPVAKEVLLDNVARCLLHRDTRSSMESSLARVEAWRSELDALVHGPKAKGAAPLDLEAFRAMALRNIIASLEDIAHLSAVDAAPRRRPCHLFDCPRLRELNAAVTEAVEVLEKTKNAFKSKELGALRQKLETVLKA